MPDASSVVRGTPLILLTGATGYVGGRLLKALERAGHHVRCLARRPAFLRARVAPTTEVASGIVLDQGTLPAALKGVRVAHYLVHSMGSTGAFAEEDRRAARHFAEPAREAGVRRLIYYGMGIPLHKDSAQSPCRDRRRLLCAPCRARGTRHEGL